jgi:prolipoprotein diacylglyceryltransferase
VLPASSTRAVIEFTFSPIAQVGPWDVRLETIALALVILAALVVAARVAGRTPIDLRRSPDELLPDDEPNHLRADDLLFITVAAIPGAVLGGRLGYALLHLDYYSANPGALFDWGQGGFELTLAVVGGTLTAVIVATLLESPVGRWLHAAILPLLLALAGGKLALVLGGTGQGTPFDGAWATAYLGQGPWGSLAPELPSNPSQVYEAVGAAGVALVLMVLLAAGAFGRRSGGAFLFGLALWSLMRVGVATTWRDPPVIGDVRMEQAIALAVAGAALVLLLAQVVVQATRGRRTTPVLEPGEVPEADTPGLTAPVADAGPPKPDWPDPASRPRF